MGIINTVYIFKQKRGKVMEFFNLVQMNLFAFIILLLIYWNIKSNSRNVLFDQQLFLDLILLTILLILADIVRVFTNGKNGSLMINLNIIACNISYLSAPFTSFIRTLYIDYKIYEDKARIKDKFFILFLPILINTFLIGLNITKGMFNGIIFSFSSDNVYSRGPYFVIVMFITYGYLIYNFIKIVKNKDKIYEKNYYSLIAFIIPPFLGGILQTIFYGIKLTWISLTLSIFIAYINIQNNRLYIDVLTGLYNRRKLNLYLDEVISDTRNKLIGGIMIDLDDFKEINDTFGHIEGDKALVHVAELLKENFRKEDFISRYAGDEFLIVLKVNRVEEIKNVVERLNLKLEEFNKKNITPYKLSFSIGYDVFHSDSRITSEWFVSRVDSLMYRQKESKKPCLDS